MRSYIFRSKQPRKYQRLYDKSNQQKSKKGSAINKKSEKINTTILELWSAPINTPKEKHNYDIPIDMPI